MFIIILHSFWHIAKFLDTSVASSNIFQTCQADFLSLPQKADTLSQPVNECKNMRAFAFCPNDKLISCIGAHLNLLPLLKAIQRFFKFKSLKRITPITTISVSVLFIMTILIPLTGGNFSMYEKPCVCFFVCTRYPSMLIAILLTYFSPFVVTLLFAASVISI